MFVEAYSISHLYTVSEATMGLEALRLLVIDMLMGLSVGGVDVPLTEDDDFDKNGEIDDEKFDEYLMQEDNKEEEKRKLLLALTNMVGEAERKETKERCNGGLAKTDPRGQENSSCAPAVVYRSSDPCEAQEDAQNERMVGGFHSGSTT